MRHLWSQSLGVGEGVSAEGQGSKVLWGAVVVKKRNHQPSLSTDQSEQALGNGTAPTPLAGQALTLQLLGCGEVGLPGPEKAKVGQDAWGGGGALTSACGPVWTSISTLRTQCGADASQPQVPHLLQPVVPMLTAQAEHLWLPPPPAFSTSPPPGGHLPQTAVPTRPSVPGHCLLGLLRMYRGPEKCYSLPDTQPHPKCTQTSFCSGSSRRTADPPSEIKRSPSGCQMGKDNFRSGFSPDYALSPLWPFPLGAVGRTSPV